jgi:DNA adenine methylase
VRPPIVYFGGKIRLAERLIALMPQHQHYVEPYCGSLAVLMAKAPVAHETVNDLDRHLMTFWRVLRQRPGDLQRVCELTPHSRAEYKVTNDEPMDGLDDLEVARRIWVQLTQSRAGLRRRSGWRHYQDPTRSTASMPDYLAGYVARMPPAVERLRRVSMECRPALHVISDYGRHREVLLYVDPPYLSGTRSSGSYLHEMGDEESHRELAAALNACEAAVVLSGYASPLYDDLYDGWHRREIETATGQGGEWPDRTEVVWCNRPFPNEGLVDLFSEGVFGEAS